MSSPPLVPPGQPLPLQPGEFTNQSQPSVVSFKLQDLSPPSNLYIRQDEFLQVQFWSTAGTAIVYTLGFRILLADGSVVVGQKQFTNIPVSATAVFPVDIPEGYLLGLIILGDTSLLKRGQTFVSVLINRGGQVGGVPEVNLVQDYVSDHNRVTWPYGRTITSTEGPGWLHTVTVGNPAAGADWTFTVPNAVRWRINSIAAVLTTSATVASRLPQLTVQDVGALTTYKAAANSLITASLVTLVAAAPASIGSSVAVPPAQAVLIPTPSDFIVEAGWIIQTNTVALQAGDQWSSININVEEWQLPQ
jgi:hypothetical protein